MSAPQKKYITKELLYVLVLVGNIFAYPLTIGHYTGKYEAQVEYMSDQLKTFIAMNQKINEKISETNDKITDIKTKVGYIEGYLNGDYKKQK